MDEIVKVIAGASPIAAIFIILGKQALEVVHDYLRVNQWQNERILERLRVIEKQLGIDPPDPSTVPPMPVTKTQN